MPSAIKPTLTQSAPRGDRSPQDDLAQRVGATLASIVISLKPSLLFIGVLAGSGDRIDHDGSPLAGGPRLVGSLSEVASLLLVFNAARRGEALAEG